MHCMRTRSRLAILLLFGFLLQAAGGCGDGSVPVDPNGGERLKQARISAYGKSGTPSGKGANVNSQAAARQQSQGNR